MSQTTEEQLDQKRDDPAWQKPPDVSAKSVGRAISWAGVGHLVAKVSWFGSLLVLAALLPPAAFGLVSAATVVIHTASLLVGTGTKGALVTSERVTVERLRYSLALTIGMGTVVTIAVAALAGPIVRSVLSDGDPEVLRWLVISVGLHALGIVPYAMLDKHMQFKRLAGIMALGSITSAAIGIVAAVLGAGVWALVIRQLLGATIDTILVWTFARRFMPPARELLGRFERPRRERDDQGWWFFLLSVTSLVALSSDYVVVGRVAGAAELGLYSIAFALGFAPLTQLSWSLGAVLMPAAAATKDLGVLARRTERALQAMGLILLPLVAPALVLAPWLLPLALGERWEGGVLPFQILFPIGVAHAMLNMIGESLSGSGNIKLHTQMHILWAVIIIPALVVLVTLEGIVGAALAHLVVLVPVAAGYLLLGARRLGRPTWALVRSLVPLLLPVSAQLAATYGATWLLLAAGAPEPLARVAGALVGVGCLAALLLRDRSGPLYDARALVTAVVKR